MAFPPSLFFHCEGREDHVVGVGNKMTGRLHLLPEISRTEEF